jgi:hypothetical protein
VGKTVNQWKDEMRSAYLFRVLAALTARLGPERLRPVLASTRTPLPRARTERGMQQPMRCVFERVGLAFVVLVLSCARAPAVPAQALVPAAPPLPCRTSLEREHYPLRDRYRFYAYDDAGRLALAFTDVAGVPADIDTYRYSADGREAFKTRIDPAGHHLTEHTVRDSRGRISRIEVTSDGQTKRRDAPDESASRARRDRFGNLIEGEAASFDCPQSGEVAFEQQDPARLIAVDDDSDGADLRIAGRVERGLRQGLWSVVTRAGPKLREVEYRDGLPIRAVTFFPSGARYEEGAFADGLRSGPWSRYWENGKLREQGTCAAGRREGDFAEFAEDGAALPSFGFKAGEPLCAANGQDGPSCADGLVVHLREGRAFGRELRLNRFDASTQQTVDVFSERHRVNGVLHGPATQWGPTGRINSDERYWLGQVYARPLIQEADGAASRSTRQLPVPKALGATLKELSDVERRELKLPAKVGVRVESLLPGLPAEVAGLLAGDVLVQVNGVPLTSQGELVDQAQKGPVRLELRRGIRSLVLVLAAAGPPSLPAAESSAALVCPSAVARTGPALNAAGLHFKQRELWMAGSQLGQLYGAVEPAEARAQALACHAAAYEFPLAQRPAWACSDLAATHLRLGHYVEAKQQAWACIDEAADAAVAARSWLLLDSSVASAPLVSFLFRPTPAARLAFNTAMGGPARSEQVLVDRAELRTGRVELPVLVAERRRTADSSEEWLWLWDKGEPGGEARATAIPVAVRKASGCAAQRVFELADGRARIRSMTRKEEWRRDCEARVVPEGDYPLEPFLSRSLSLFSFRRQLPAAVEREWRLHLPKELAETAADRSIAADDLNLDGELDWLIRTGATVDVVQGGATPHWLGSAFGREVSVRPDLSSGFRSLELADGAGPEAAAVHLYVFSGLSYVRVPYQPVP